MSEAQQALAEATDMNIVNTAVNKLRVGRKLEHAESHDYPFTSEAPADGQSFYIYNVGQHRFFCGGAKWGTHAALGWPGIEVTLKRISGNTYAIDTHVKGAGDNEHWLNSSAYLDHDAETYGWTFVKQTGGTYVIRSAEAGTILGFAPFTQLDGELYYDHVALLAGADIKNPDNQWLLVSREQRNQLLAKASADSPIDASHYIKMPNFSQHEYEEAEGGWDGANGAWKHNTVGDAGNITISERGACYPDFAFQCWNANPLNLTQTITVPPGRYEMTLNGFYREGNKENHTAILTSGGTPKQPAKLYVNNTEVATLPGIHEAANMLPGVGWKGEAGEWADVAHDAVEYFQCGYYFVESDEFEVGERGRLIIALRKSNAKAYDWTLVDNFRLICLGLTDANGITEVNDELSSANSPLSTIHNLAGQSILTPTSRGIYIIKGNKVLIK